jgi:glucoside 3-dehydrogenase (cytochrome c) catalytic subunit
MNNKFDAIVVGSGISGGWAVKELCEKGLKTIVLERGKNVIHPKDYTTAFNNPWDFDLRLTNSLKSISDSPIQSNVYTEEDKHFYVNDKDHPYTQVKPFNWIRGYQVGGRSLTWSRHCYRLSDLDFEANLKEGIGVDWPIRYKDIKPWYDYVEKYIGVSGTADGLKHLPDGKFLPPIEMNCIESHFTNKIKEHYRNRTVINGRVANLTKALHGRGPCQFRNLCSRGCPFGGYFSSNSATLPDAKGTGNLTLKTNAIVKKVLYDEYINKAIGVTVVDSRSGKERNYYARIIFLNASTIATSSILLNSRSERFPNGLGNSSGQVGRNLMDHFIKTGAEGEFHGYLEKYYFGRSPNNIYIPRFRNISKETKVKDFIRGYAFQGISQRMGWQDSNHRPKGFGVDFKNKLLKPGVWTLLIRAWGETLPYTNNRVTLNHRSKDNWGLPLIKVDMEYHENEEAMRNDIIKTSYEMLQVAGFKNIKSFNFNLAPGSAIHEMGTARMGHNPKTSVLNLYNQMHDVPNVYITDGSCMTSSANQNPSLTYMALTARACDHAVKSLKNGEI